MAILKGADPGLRQGCRLKTPDPPKASAKPQGLNRGKWAENSKFQGEVLS